MFTKMKLKRKVAREHYLLSVESGVPVIYTFFNKNRRVSSGFRWTCSCGHEDLVGSETSIKGDFRGHRDLMVTILLSQKGK